MGNKLFETLLARLPVPLHAKAFSLYPPFIGAGIFVESIAPDARRVVVAMTLRPWTRNLFGTHFGGSLYAMTDPFYSYILQMNVGNAYICWDKSARIRFRKPGRGTVRAVFEVSDEEIARVRAALEQSGKLDAEYTTRVTDERGEVVAEIERVVSIRLGRG